MTNSDNVHENNKTINKNPPTTTNNKEGEIVSLSEHRSILDEYKRRVRELEKEKRKALDEKQGAIETLKELEEENQEILVSFFLSFFPFLLSLIFFFFLDRNGAIGSRKK